MWSVFGGGEKYRESPLCGGMGDGAGRTGGDSCACRRFYERLLEQIGGYSLKMWAAGREVFRLHADTSDFEQSRWINVVKDFDLYREKKTVYKVFGRYQFRARGTCNVDDGYVVVPKDSVVPVRLELTDVAGHRSVVELKLVGGDSLPAVLGKKVLLPGREYRLCAGDYTLIYK